MTNALLTHCWGPLEILKMERNLHSLMSLVTYVLFLQWRLNLSANRKRRNRKQKTESVRHQKETKRQKDKKTDLLQMNRETWKWREGAKQREGGWVGVMHAGQEARGKISDRHYGDTELSDTHTHTHKHLNHLICYLRQGNVLQHQIEIMFQRYNWSGSLYLLI